MKASEVLRRYAEDRRDFSGENLRGQSFKGENLSGANFSNADIRSTNFAGANLRGANFTDAKCGLQRRWATFLFISYWLLAVISGVISSLLFVYLASQFFASNLDNQIISLIVMILLFVIILRQGIKTLEAFLAIVAGIVLVVAMGTLGLTLGIVGALAGIIFIVLLSLTTEALAGEVGLIVTGSFAVVPVLEVILNGVQGAELFYLFRLFAVLFFIVTIGILYIHQIAIEGNKRYAWIHSFVIVLASKPGTSFRDADLTESNFNGAKLKSTDLSGARLTHVSWQGTQIMDSIHPGETYLQYFQVRQCLMSTLR